MRNLPFIITAVLVMGIMLAVAIWSRNGWVGPSRSVRFGNAVVINVDSTKPVAVLIEAVQPDGTRTPVAWAYLGLNQGASHVQSVTFPSGVPLVVTCTTGMQVVQTIGSIETVLADGETIAGGPAQAGTALQPMPGASAGMPWKSTVTPPLGMMLVVRPTSTGGSMSFQAVAANGAFLPAQSPPPPPPPPAPSDEKETPVPAGGAS